MSTALVIANILGYIGYVLLFIQIVFGSRHIFKYFTRDTVFINRWHKRIGTYGIIFVFAHPIQAMVAYMSSFSWIFIPNFYTPSEVAITFGRFALFILLIVWITSAIVREKIKWRPWKYIHLLSYPLFIFVFFHLSGVGSFFIEYVWLRTIVQLLFIFFLVSIVIRLFTWAGFGKLQYRIDDINYVGQGLTVLTLIPMHKKELSVSIGQHAFLQARSFASEHPFSVMEYDKESGKIIFGIRKVGGFWNELQSKKVGDIFLMDGTYGTFTREGWNEDKKVIISGGIGVTPFVQLAIQYGKNAYYINCNRNLGEAIRRTDLMSHVDHYLDIVNEVDEEGSGVKRGIITTDIVKEFIGEDLLSSNYFICGSPKFIEIVRNMLVSLGVKKDKVYYEELGF